MQTKEMVKQNQCHDVQPDVLQQHISFNPDKLKRVCENEESRFCFVLLLISPVEVKVHETDEKWLKSMVSMSLICMKKTFKSLSVMFSTTDCQPSS